MNNNDNLTRRDDEVEDGKWKDLDRNGRERGMELVRSENMKMERRPEKKRRGQEEMHGNTLV